MNDWGKSVLEQYEVEVKSTRKGRGALLCETNKGLLILQEYMGSIQHMEEESRVLNFLLEKGGMNVDVCIRDKNGRTYTENKEGTRYVLKKWYDYTECNVNSRSELEMAVRTLAKLHMLLRHVDVISTDENGIQQKEKVQSCHSSEVHSSLLEEYEKHNRELRRVRSFIRNKKKKTAFELCIVESFDEMFAQAEEATERLIHSNYQNLYINALKQKQICHGSYHQHNILIKGSRIAVVNFQKFYMGIQLMDLYYFMRKILEKHNWDVELGSILLEDYNRILPISKEEMEVLHAMFLYPEKYWKQMNFYYNTNKVWIPDKNLEKLKKAAEQKSIRAAFLRIL
ncbi:Spore coat protein I [Clostridiales bacterium CHKCI001]|nr:Spore coat protein I [Clostridiales bacterium CHKCI001]